VKFYKAKVKVLTHYFYHHFYQNYNDANAIKNGLDGSGWNSLYGVLIIHVLHKTATIQTTGLESDCLHSGCL